MGRTPQIFQYPGCSTGSFERPRWEIGPNNRLALGLMRASWPAFIIVRFSVERAVGLCPKGVYGLALGGAFAGLAPGTRGGSACRRFSRKRKVTRVSRPERTSKLCFHSDHFPWAFARRS